MEPMHIVGHFERFLDVTGLNTNMKARCGKPIGSGAPRNAPMCRQCVRIAGWVGNPPRPPK